MEVLVLAVFAFLAGFVDSVVGGGGLVQIPALLFVLPTAAPATVFGTNKVASMAGTSFAVARYTRSIEIPWDILGPSTVAAFLGSFGGAQCVRFADPAIFRPLVLGLLFGVFVYTLAKKDLGRSSGARGSPAARVALGIAIGGGIGFYDGFFGPGTGSFLVFLFASVLGLDFLVAAASAKVVNLATNVAAVGVFAWAGTIRWDLALPMAVCNVLGSVLGTRLALSKGTPFIRVLFLVVVGGLLLRLGYDTFVAPR
ncbi:MAG: TSUP family transporter [Polyangiales bacterium]